MEDLKKAGRVRIVITQRFLSYTEHGYFTYAGVVYPIGRFREGHVLHFNPSLIQEVVHRGFADEQDTAYVSLMKQELIIKQEKRSYEHAGRAECGRLAGYMEEQHGRRD